MSQDARLDPQMKDVLATGQDVSPARQQPTTSSGLLGRLSVGQKLALAGLLVGVPFALSLGSLVAQQNAQVRQDRKSVV